MAAPSGGAGGVDGGGGPAGSGSGGGGGKGRVKGSWTPEEDDLLRRAVARHGPRNWSLISAEIPGRSGKSCRLRWCNQLSPGVERRPFTPEEDAVIVAAHAQYGNKWATIARMMHGRTDNSVKNHWNSTLRRQRRAAAAAANAGCAALPLRPLAAAATIASGPPLPLRQLLPDPEESSPSTAPASAVPFQPLDLKRGDGGGDDEEEEEEDDEDGSSEDSVLMPPPKKRPCIGVGAGQTHPSRGAAKKPDRTKPLPPPTAPAPAEPVTSLTLSLPGVGGGGGAVPEAPAPQSAVAAAATSLDGVAKMRAKLEQEWPWLQPVNRQMICEEVQRQLQGAYVPCSLVASPAAGGANGRAAASSQD